jgi:hypothetical protein
LQLVLDVPPFPPRVAKVPLWQVGVGLAIAATLVAWSIVSAVLLAGPRWSGFVAGLASLREGHAFLDEAASVASRAAVVAASPFALSASSATDDEPETGGSAADPAQTSSAPRPLALPTVLPTKGQGFVLENLLALADSEAGAVNVTFRMAGTTGALRRGLYTVKATFARPDGQTHEVEPAGTPGAVAYALRNFADRSHTFRLPAPDARLVGVALVVKDEAENVAATFAVDLSQGEVADRQAAWPNSRSH